MPQTRIRRWVAPAVALTLAGILVANCSNGGDGDRAIRVGRPPEPVTTAGPASTIARPPAIVVPPPDLGRPPITEPPPSPGLVGPDGRPYGAPLVFRSDVVVPDELMFVLVIGSDARPGQDPARSRSDSVHLLAVDPRTLQGTVLGFPRDSWVEVPGRGNQKLANVLPLGGPDLVAESLRHLTGLPVDFWVLTGFAGLSAIVDELGGIDVHVDRRMNDAFSGARFEPGWHHMTGAEALAYSRDRHDVSHGDFTRSLHQGDLILAALAKMRAEVADDDGVRAWLGVLTRHVTFDDPLIDLLPLGVLARRIDPAGLRNEVVPGKVGSAGGQSVVLLGADAARIFADLRPDAVLGEPVPVTTTSSTSTSTTLEEPTETTETTETTEP